MSGRRRPPLTECRNCTMPIRFVNLNTGSKVPVNPKPGDTGTVAARLVAGQLVGRMIHADDPPTEAEERYVVHFATCDKRPAATPKEPAPPEPSLF